MVSPSRGLAPERRNTRTMKHRIVPIAFMGLAACAPEANQTPVTQTAQASQGATAQIAPICLRPLVNVEPRRSLTVTDHNILIPAAGGRDFSLRRVLTQIASQAGEPGGAVELFTQLWDTQNPSPGQGLGFNCTDAVGNPSIVNGFDYGCRPGEGGHVNNAARKLDEFHAVSLVNRFDLAPEDGSNCGEYRIVFENGDVDFNRAFLIMEAVLPNPNPKCGIAACRPVQQMWARLTTTADPNTRADRLEEFYFDGITGFAPVVHFTHFLNTGGGGYGTSDTGQFRTNAFIDRPWMLKEFKLERTCRQVPIIEPVPTESTTTLTKVAAPTTRTVCDLNFVPVSVKDNPFPDLFNPASVHPLAANFVNHIDDQVACLAIDDINGFGYCGLDNVYNHNESAAEFGSSDYRNQFGGGGGPLGASIQGALTAIGSPLTPAQIVGRAEALSCKGCHAHASGAALGFTEGNFPVADFAGFVHNTEFPEPGPDGTRFRISDGLTDSFLPFRKGVMEGFLSESACVTCGSITLSTQTKAATSGSAPPARTISGSRAIH